MKSRQNGLFGFSGTTSQPDLGSKLCWLFVCFLLFRSLLPHTHTVEKSREGEAGYVDATGLVETSHTTSMAFTMNIHMRSL
jgi:hypothetical protein